MNSITVEDLKSKMEDPHFFRDNLVVDVRTQDEWNEARVEGMTLIPLDQLLLHETELKAAKTIYMFCRSGGRSAMCCQELTTRKIAQPINVEGGILAWAAAKFPVVSTA